MHLSFSLPEIKMSSTYTAIIRWSSPVSSRLYNIHGSAWLYIHPISSFVHNLMNAFCHLNPASTFPYIDLTIFMYCFSSSFLLMNPNSFIESGHSKYISVSNSAFKYAKTFYMSIPWTPSIISVIIILMLLMNLRLMKMILYSWRLVLGEIPLHKVLSCIAQSCSICARFWIPTYMVWFFFLLILLLLWMLSPSILFSGNFRFLILLMISKLFFSSIERFLYWCWRIWIRYNWCAEKKFLYIIDLCGCS